MNHIEMELKQYADRFPSKEIWHNHILASGFYLPDIATYKWKWGLRKAFNSQCNFFCCLYF